MNSGHYTDAALVVLGHGTTLNAESALPVRQHAAELRRRRLFASVHEAFWKQAPLLPGVLAALTAPRVFIAPLFISEGYFSAEVIPRELGFGAPPVLRLPGQTRYYCQPAGSHEAMTEVILARAAAVVRQHPFPRAPKPRDITLFIAGHGTDRHSHSRRAGGRQADLIRALNLYADVHEIYMEESPRIPDCYSLARTKHLVVVPFFISDGLHVAADIPVLLGEPEELVRTRLAAGQPAWRNPAEKNGKLVWYSPAVGTDPLLAGVILERVMEAAGAGWKG